MRPSPHRETQLRPGLSYGRDRGGQPALFCEKVSLASLAEQYGTPLYVYSERALRERTQLLDHAFRSAPHRLCYAVKANSTLGILRLMASLGCGFDVVSGGELQRALRADRKAARRVVFSGVGKTAGEIEAAIRAGILMFNVESEQELDQLAACALRLRRTARVALRVNPNVSAKTHPYISTGLRQHKFGIPIEDARRLYSRAAMSRYLEVAGVSVHIGSQITETAPFGLALGRVAELVRELKTDGHSIHYVDAGGGLGIDYEHGDSATFGKYAATYARAILKPLRKLGVQLLLEPGRVLVGPAGVLLTRVIYTKSNRGKHFVIVDAGMNDLLRPALYGAHHEIVPVVRHADRGEVMTDIVGPVCESGDFLARDRNQQSVEPGELMAVLDAGAYGSVLASNYNTRPRPAEVMVRGQKSQIIRRRETVADLMRGED